MSSNVVALHLAFNPSYLTMCLATKTVLCNAEKMQIMICANKVNINIHLYKVYYKSKKLNKK